MKKLKIAFITPEAVPFAKTGGLGDISGVLPGILSEMGHSVRLFMPMYRQVIRALPNIKRIDMDLDCLVGDGSFKVDLYHLSENDTGLEIYFIGNNCFFDRPELYRDPTTGQDYIDNDERFIFFCQAVIETVKRLDWRVDIYHANDWQTALIPSYLKTKYKDDNFFKDSASVFTIHNMAYQGQFPLKTADKIGIDDSYFNPIGPFEYWGKINLMKGAINFADLITTVSPTYAREIQTGNEYGMGLEGVLKNRSDSLFGILNGIDFNTWTPKRDSLIPYKYHSANLSGKKKNKLELLHKAGFPIRMEQPLFGMISRLDSQKGFDLLEEIMDDMLKLDLQFILLGTGENKYHEFFMAISGKYPNKFKPFLKFDNSLAHLIEAGADIFLMPSRYEPCGLNQMYSLNYATVPLVRKTGGLADTVVDFNEETMVGTGFVFEKYNSIELLSTITRATRLFKRKRIWYKIMKQGMSQDFSWNSSAQKYSDIYFKALLKT